MGKRLVLLIGLLLLLLGWAAPVSAHAELVRSIPESNASLARSPAQVELYLSEPVDLRFSFIKVYDASGAQVDNKDTHLDPSDATHLAVSLRSLKDGIYIVSWKVISAVDAHDTNGTFPFAVGNVDAAALAKASPATSGASLAPGGVAAKGLLYLAIAVLTGGLAFTSLVWDPAARQVPEAAPAQAGATRRFHGLLQIGVGLVVLASLLTWLFQSGQASGTGVAAPWSAQALDTLLGARLGALLLARLVLALLLAGLLLPPPNRWNRPAAAVAALLLLLTVALESHSAAQPKPLLPVAADVAHLAGASVWVGGLFLFLTGLLAARRLDPPAGARLTARLIPRFSALAIASVGVLSLTGLYSAVLSVGTLLALVTTDYGKALLVKSVIALIMLGLGAVNLLVTSPSMQRAAAAPQGSPSLVSRFRRLVTGEVGLGILLLLWVGVFTTLPPARVNTAPAEADFQTVQDGLGIQVKVVPARPGINTFTVSLSANGKPVADAGQVLLRFTPNFGNLAPIEAALVGSGNGLYTTRGAYLAFPDRWQVQAVIRRQGQFDVYHNFDLDLTGTAQAPIAWRQVAVACLGLLGPAGAFALLANLRRRRPAVAAGALMVLVFLALAALAYAHPAAAAQAEPSNPVSPSPASVSAGEKLYQQNCQTCHGPNGKGDGPVGITLNPRPADLSLHAIPGVHTDGQLYLWISSGFPGSVMPGFSQKLTEIERWDLVNYIRTLAPR